MKLLLLFVLAGVGVVSAAQVPAAPASLPKPAPTAAQVTDAKTRGLVWVNHYTKVFYKSDSVQYGATRNGEFMTEAEAIKGKNRLAKEFQPKIGKRPAGDSKAAEGKK